MIKVAITGNIASGKSETEKIIKNLGLKVLCTDKVAHDLLDNDKAVRGEVYETFKTNNRAEMGEIVFSNSELKVKLERIVHPAIKAKVQKFFSENKDEKAVFVSVPLLYETKWEGLFDKVILVTAPDNVRLERLLQRNSFTKEQAMRRIGSQMPQKEKVLKADYIINNDGSLEQLKVQTEKVIEALGLHE